MHSTKTSKYAWYFVRHYMHIECEPGDKIHSGYTATVTVIVRNPNNYFYRALQRKWRNARELAWFSLLEINKQATCVLVIMTLCISIMFWSNFVAGTKSLLFLMFQNGQVFLLNMLGIKFEIISDSIFRNINLLTWYILVFLLVVVVVVY